MTGRVEGVIEITVTIPTRLVEVGVTHTIEVSYLISNGSHTYIILVVDLTPKSKTRQK